MEKTKKNWKATANSRLNMELAGLSFALKKGDSHEEYAQHLWGEGAKRWIKKDKPTPREYIKRELEAFGVLFPHVRAEIGRCDDDVAELIFVKGCPCGWGKDKWAKAKCWGLRPKDVCRYCTAAFSIWGEQLGLRITLNPQEDGCCILTARGKPKDTGKAYVFSAGGEMLSS